MMMMMKRMCINKLDNRHEEMKGDVTDVHK